MIDEIALLAHGWLSALNVLAAVYNYKRGHKFRAFFHLCVAAYEVWAAMQHMKEKHEKTE